MGSYMGDSGNRDKSRRKGAIKRRRNTRVQLESLESRMLLTNTPPNYIPTTNVLTDIQHGPMANAGQDLITVYQNYQLYRANNQVGNFAASPQNTLKNFIKFSGDSVAVTVYAYGDFGAYLTAARNVGLQFTAQSVNAQYQIVEGLLPINQLPALAMLRTASPLSGTDGMLAQAPPRASSQGIAPNQGEKALLADVAKTQFGINGAGTTVGVMSVSVNRFAGGLADSVRTGDLPNNVNVLFDNDMPAGSPLLDDEGRAMLEEVYDVAPGAGLAYYNAFGLAGGETVMATGVRALANQGKAGVIVDDIGFAFEPYYQDGMVAQAITDVTQLNNVAYFSSAGNSADDGFESPFRGVNTTVTGVGAGHFMNFDPSGGTNALLPITVTQAGRMVFQFDQPFGTGVTSNVNIFVLDANNNVVASGTQNNIASNLPYQDVIIPSTGSFRVAIQVVGGNDPGRVAMYDFGSSIAFSHQFGNNGGISYPTTFGHATGPDTIGVGATPWFNDPAWDPGLTPTPTEGFSSFGPSVHDINPDGSRAPLQIRQKPDLSGPDGITTSFFVPGQTLDTTNPPPGTGVPTTTNLNPPNLPNFFGTSAAAPNLAALAALMRQLAPGTSSANIKAAMASSAIPLNGSAKGVWNVQGGLGLPQAPAALSLIDRLRVVAETPATGGATTSAPPFLVVTFSRAINPATLQPSDLVFTGVPAGVTVSVGQPMISLAAPTVVVFPLTFTETAGVKANGVYSYKLADGSITSADGRTLAAFAGTFNVQDTIAPRITNTTFNGRIITIQFSEPMQPSQLNAANVELVRTGGIGIPFNNPANVIVTSDPRTIYNYDSVTHRLTINLSSLPQTALPSDHYALVVVDSVTDLVGNRLDGEFSGKFPSGNGTEGGIFVQDLGVQQLFAPQITSVALDQGSAARPTSDSGIANDQNTNVQRPTFVGTVSAAFPASAAGVQVVVEFQALHNGVFDLGLGAPNSNDPLLRPRGFTGPFDVITTTDANGNFTFTAPQNLPDGFHPVRVVVVGASDQPPQSGYSSFKDTTFRVDTTKPIITSTVPASATNLAGLTTMVFNVSDPILPNTLGNPLSVPTTFVVPALNPARANNISNYSLIRLGADGVLGTADDQDLSSFITQATFVAGPTRPQTNSPYTGTITLKFATGLPAGVYDVIARAPSAGFQGITDAAGNSIVTNTPANTAPGFIVQVTLQPVPAFITSVDAMSTDPTTGAVTDTGPRGYFETPVPGVVARAPSAPDTFDIILSNSLDLSKISLNNPLDPQAVNPDLVQLIRSANTNSNPNNPADGDFNTYPSGVDTSFQIVNAGGALNLPFTRITGTTLRLVNSVPGAQPGEPGYLNELELTLAAGTSLPPDYYRLFLPNTIGQFSLTSSATEDLRLFDIFGNQVDGEFLGNPTGNQSGEPTPDGFVDLLPTGQLRPGLSGDGQPGGAFETGYTVVPNGNIIFARPDYIDNPFLPSTTPDGSPEKPYPALAPEAVANSFNGGDLNSSINFTHNGPDNSPDAKNGFDADLDLNGNGSFDPSAFYAAKVRAAFGPVVIVAQASKTISVNASTGISYTKTYALQDKLQHPDNTLGDGSASIPGMTTLVFQPGTVVKMRNASLFVQNQGSALEVLGGPNPVRLGVPSPSAQVVFTSFNDDTIGGPAWGVPASAQSAGGDWGGVVFRNFNDVVNGRNTLFPIDGKLGLSGADEALSIMNNTSLKFGGGVVPKGAANSGTNNFFRYDEITLFNSRPAITNDSISDTATGVAVGGGTQAGISVDFDSLREDELARGPLIRATTTLNNSINGIYVRAEQSGFTEQTDAQFYQDNEFTNPDGTPRRNFVLDDPLPYVFITRVVLGQGLIQNSGGVQGVNGVVGVEPENRLYVQPGMVLKFNHGAALELVTVGASFNVGDRTYMNEFDAKSNFGPTNPDGTPNASYRPPTTGDAPVILTSFFDNQATTSGSFIDPATGLPAVIVPPLDSSNGGGANQPTPGNVPPLARWGGIDVTTGAVAMIDEATFSYGGGQVNSLGGTVSQRDVLNFSGSANFSVGGFSGLGTRAYITNNNFQDNLGAAIGIEPDGLLAADPLRPLVSGNPFFRGNVMLRNGANGMEVFGNTLDPIFLQRPTLTVNSVWDDTDLTYILRGTIALEGYDDFFFGGALPPVPSGTQFLPEEKPHITLTLQSTLPGTLLANGQSVARPGESLIIKTQNPTVPGGGADPLIGNAVTGMGTGQGTEGYAGAGFTVGYDNGIDPTADPYLDLGLGSQIRIVGVGGNETTGQKRVPVVITSVFDDTVGNTVRGVGQFQAFTGNTIAPQPGDGGNIVFGGLSLSSYNLLDPRGGNIIDNADIRYMTRIEVQGGGVTDLPTGTTTTYAAKLGITPATQLNFTRAITISNSNLGSFRDEAVMAHPDFRPGLFRSVTVDPVTGGVTAGPITRAGNSAQGQPTNVLMLNDTIANTPIGVQIQGEQGADNGPTQDDVTQFIALNNTFYNNPIALNFVSRAYTGRNPNSHINAILMDNIFANSTNTSIISAGQMQGSQAQYNLFSNNAAIYTATAQGPTQPVGIGFLDPTRQGSTSIIGQANFVDSANLNFALQPDSAAIDASRSELALDNEQSQQLTPLIYMANGMLRSLVAQALDSTGGVRIANARTYDFNLPADPTNILTLPGSTFKGNVKDEFQAALPGTPGAVPGPSSGTSGYWWIPIGGERDQTGFIRTDDPNRPNVGTGSKPFFDIGANEFRILVAPHVTGVTATLTDPTIPTGVKTTNIYVVGGIAGTNVSPQTIQFTFDNVLDPNSVTNQTVLLQASGGDGIFGNNNVLPGQTTSTDKFIDLSGKLVFDPTTKTVTINFGGLKLPNDEYRIILEGSGSDVLTDPTGNALDGENTVGAAPNGAQLAIPSGNGVPGGNFFVTFTVDTNPPSVVPKTFVLAAASDTNRRDGITSINLPSFTGTVFDVFPPANPASGQMVTLDISSKGDGVFDLMGVGTAVTDAQGNFTVTSTVPVPDSPFNVGPDGLLGTADDTGYGLARVRITDQSGNTSNPNDPKAMTGFVVDTQPPAVTSANPAPGTAATVLPGNVVPVTINVSQNIEPASLTANSIQVFRSGGDGIFGNGNDVAMLIDPASISVQVLHTSKGAEAIHFNIISVTTNDIYQVTLKGTGQSPVIDIAGNKLGGQFNGVFPTSGAAGTDFNESFIVFNPALTKIIYVGTTPSGTFSTTPDGSRANPYPTIMGQTVGTVAQLGGMTAANPGDIVAVIAGSGSNPTIYNENVVLKSLVKLISADPTSTSTRFVPGIAQETILRAPAANPITILGNNVLSIPAWSAEVSGFTIASPLTGNLSTGPINPSSVGVILTNSDVLIDKNYIIDSGLGVAAVTAGPGSMAPRIMSNGIIGNINGMVLSDKGATGFANGSSSTGQGVVLANNTIAFNTTGLLTATTGGTTGVQLIDVVNNIFAQNTAPGNSGSGSAITSFSPGRIGVRDNLFSNNAPNPGSPGAGVQGIGGGFNPALIGPRPDPSGNFSGNPAFASPVDPRPTGNGPAAFILGANFDLTVNSAAIDNSLQSAAPALDFRYRSRVDIPGKGFAGRGPADVGAFEFNGLFGVPANGLSNSRAASAALVSAASFADPSGPGNSSPSSTGSSTVTTTAVATGGSVNSTPSTTPVASSIPTASLAPPPAVSLGHKKTKGVKTTKAHPKPPLSHAQASNANGLAALLASFRRQPKG
jgi:large repetitive protein